MADYNKKDITQGALFVNGRKSASNQPDFRGELTLSKALLKELVEAVKSGGEAKLSLSVWKKQSKAGNEYMSVAGQVFKDYKKSDNDIEVPF